MDQQTLTATQFGASAANYLASPVHANGVDLDRLKQLAIEIRPSRVLDLGCGAGHASFALAAGGARRITAFDPSSQMRAVVRQEAASRGYAQIETCAGSAEALPFDDETFDLVVSRFSAHHWAGVPRALAECARVLAPRGLLIIIDTIAPEKPLLDTCLQVLEFLRDASHVRNYRVTEWRAMQQTAGFDDSTVDDWKLPMEFDGWIARIGTPPDRVAALQSVFAALPTEAGEYFKVRTDHSFVIDAAWMQCRKVE